MSPAPNVDRDGPFQMQISSLAYSSYVGAIGIGRIQRGTVKGNAPVVIVDRDGERRNGRVLQVLGFSGLTRIAMPEAAAGDIVAFTGIEELKHLRHGVRSEKVEACRRSPSTSPRSRMTFQVNELALRGTRGQVSSPAARSASGSSGSSSTTSRCASRTPTMQTTSWSRAAASCTSRILIENMRREGYELAVSRPAVIEQGVDGAALEP